MTLLKGVDVSGHQPADVLTRVHSDFALIKATGGTGYVNPYASVQRATAPRRAGFYHFAGDGYPWTTPEAEAAHFLAQWSKLAQPGDIPVLDWEWPAPVQDTAWALRWLKIVAEATGKTPLLYCNLSVANSYDWHAVQIAGVQLWLALYGDDKRVDGYQDKPRPVVGNGWGHPAIWQYTQHGYLPGYAGNLDLNIAYEDLWSQTTDLVPGVGGLSA